MVLACGLCLARRKLLPNTFYFSLLTSLSFFASVLDRSENNQQVIIGDYDLGKMIESKIPTQVSLIEKYGKRYRISDFV